MSHNRTNVAGSRFDSKTQALRPGEPLQLDRGDLAVIAQAVGRSTGHVHRIISGERVSPHLQMQIEQYVGWPLAHIRLPFAKKRAA